METLNYGIRTPAVGYHAKTNGTSGVRVALSEARRKWVQDQVASAVGRSEQKFKFVALETAARRRREVPRNGPEASGDLSKRSALLFSCFLPSA